MDRTIFLLGGGGGHETLGSALNERSTRPLPYWRRTWQSVASLLVAVLPQLSRVLFLARGLLLLRALESNVTSVLQGPQLSSIGLLSALTQVRHSFSHSIYHGLTGRPVAGATRLAVWAFRLVLIRPDVLRVTYL